MARRKNRILSFMIAFTMVLGLMINSTTFQVSAAGDISDYGNCDDSVTVTLLCDYPNPWYNQYDFKIENQSGETIRDWMIVFEVDGTLNELGAGASDDWNTVNFYNSGNTIYVFPTGNRVDIEIPDGSSSRYGTLQYSGPQCKSAKVYYSSVANAFDEFKNGGSEHTHTLQHVTAKSPTCTETGNTEYWYCEECGTYFADEAAENEIAEADTIIKATGHDYSSKPTYTWADDNTTVTAEVVCKNDSDHVIRETVETDFETITFADCTNNGIGKYTAEFENSRFSTQTKNVEIPATGHSMTHFVGKEATCEEEGSIEYWKCSKCNKLYSDAEGKKEITPEQLIVPAKGHDWGDWQVITPATEIEEGLERRVCNNDNSHVEERAIPKIAHIHKYVKHNEVKATCTEGGNTEYFTCKNCNLIFVEKDGQKVQTDQEKIYTDKLGHDYGAISCSWVGDDHLSAIATRPCSRCQGLSEEVNAVIDETKEPTCTVKGTRIYTATFEMPGAAPLVYEEKIDALGHDIKLVKGTSATCEESGTMQHYKCKRCEKCYMDEGCKTLLSTVEIPAKGHDYGNAEYTWATDNSYVNGVIRCKNDFYNDHLITAKAETKYEVIVEPDIEKEGLGRYTAIFKKEGFGIISKDVKIAAKQKPQEDDNTDDNQSGGQSGGGNNDQQGTGGGSQIPVINPGSTDTGTQAPVAAPAPTPEVKESAEEEENDGLSKDGTSLGEGASIERAERAILASDSEEGPAGTKFCKLQLGAAKVSNKSIKIKWNKLSGATYTVYGNKCGKGNKFVKLATVSGDSYTQNKLKKGTYYKYIVIAAKDGKVLSSSKSIHIATKGGKVCNPKKVKLNKKKLTLKVNKVMKVKAAQKAESKKLSIKTHRSVTFESSDESVATVTPKGIVKAVGKGSAYIYAYAQNGARTRMVVNVK